MNLPQNNSALTFSRSQMLELVNLGFKDVMNHDCKASRCVLPDGPVIDALLPEKLAPGT